MTLPRLSLNLYPSCLSFQEGWNSRYVSSCPAVFFKDNFWFKVFFCYKYSWLLLFSFAWYSFRFSLCALLVTQVSCRQHMVGGRTLFSFGLFTSLNHNSVIILPFCFFGVPLLCSLPFLSFLLFFLPPSWVLHLFLCHKITTVLTPAVRWPAVFFVLDLSLLNFSFGGKKTS